jgi:tRNA pseudouridine38-40 synthase
MRNFLATLEYDGTDLLGFQLQKRGRTVQGELERALEQITGERVRVVGGGRTDAGVHASGQTASFKTEWQGSVEVLQRALNGNLPRDIVVRALRVVPDRFSARYSAVSRTYRYTIYNHPARSPLAERFALHVGEALEAGAMADAAGLLVGEKDFGAFGTPPRGEKTIRVMRHVEVRRAGDMVFVELTANAFLYRMVRRIVGTLLKVGSGRMSQVEFRAVLERKQRAGDSVPPHGLCLVRVDYDWGVMNEDV